MSAKNMSLISAFASAVFAADADDNLIRESATRHVRKTARSAERFVTYEVPKLKVSVLDFAIEQARAKAQVPTEHTVKTKNTDGSITETKRTSDLLTDEVMADFNRVSEDATEAYLTKGNLAEYVGAHVYGVSTDRVTESRLHKDILAARAQLGLFVFELAKGWSDETAEILGVPDLEAAQAKQANICVTVASLNGQLEELIAAKALREAKAADKAAKKA
jgi:hypothetical protein